jgi:hypothetical protein
MKKRRKNKNKNKNKIKIKNLKNLKNFFSLRIFIF